MTTPANKEIDKWGRDWNDDSVKGEQPYGKQIGDSAPYTEKVIDDLTDMVLSKMNGNKTFDKKPGYNEEGALKKKVE